MVLTVLEATVKKELWEQLREAYRTMTAELPNEVIASYLIQSQTNQSTWKIMTVWKNKEALATMRSSGETPTGVVIFNKAQANPTLTIAAIQEVATH